MMQLAEVELTSDDSTYLWAACSFLWRYIKFYFDLWKPIMMYFVDSASN